jgi:hypothetical protein
MTNKKGLAVGQVLIIVLSLVSFAYLMGSVVRMVKQW